MSQQNFNYYCRTRQDYVPHFVIDTNTDNPDFNVAKVQTIHEDAPPFIVQYGKNQTIPNEYSKRVELNATEIE